MKYLFILGQSPDLAKQEILSLLLPADKVITVGNNFILLDTKQTPEFFMSILGGTVKIANYVKNLKDLNELKAELWYEWLDKQDDQKVNFGFSLYAEHNKHYRRLQQLGLEVKKILKANNHKARFVVSREPILSSVIVAKNNLLKNELLIIKEADGWILGLTQVVQDFVNFGYRDMGRPERDDQSGMLPPKVAQMMLNLAGSNRNKVLLDPFCGSGTILQEATLLNYKKIYGSDKSSQAVSDSQANINWLRQKFNTAGEVIIKKINVENLSQSFPDNSIDLIVTEPFMGPARFMQRHHQSNDFYQIATDLQQLYLSAWQQFAKIVKSGGQIIFIFPIFNSGPDKIYTLLTNKIGKLGFKLIKPQIKSENLSENGNIIYARPNQKVWREITIWEKI